MLRVRIIAPLKFISVPETVTGIIHPNFKIVPQRDGVFGKNFDSPKFRKAFGQMTINNLVNFPCLFYDGNLVDLSSHFAEDTPNQTLERINAALQYYFDILWCYKDNSILGSNCIMVLGEVRNESFFLNTRFLLYSNAEGNYSPIVLTQDDADRTNLLFYKISDSHMKSDTEPRIIDDQSLSAGSNVLKNPLTFSPYDYDRIHRAIIMLQLARTSSFLPVKISQYVVLLESLTSTDENTEVSHQVSERVANLTGLNKANKLEIYKDVKEGYSIRSKFLHGQKLMHKPVKKSVPMTVEHMQNVSIKIDKIARTLMNIAIDKFELFNGPDENLRKFLIGDLFSD